MPIMSLQILYQPSVTLIMQGTDSGEASADLKIGTLLNGCQMEY